MAAKAASNPAQNSQRRILNFKIFSFMPVHRKLLLTIFLDEMEVQILNPMEIFAAKGNALISRAASRDLYDWGNMIESGLFESNRDLFRKCFAFYATISAERINDVFDTSAIDTLNFTKIRRELFPVLSKKIILMVNFYAILNPVFHGRLLFVALRQLHWDYCSVLINWALLLLLETLHSDRTVTIP